MQASSQLYMDAIDILADQDEGKEGLSGDLFRQAIGKLQRCCSRACDVPEVGMDLIFSEQEVSQLILSPPNLRHQHMSTGPGWHCRHCVCSSSSEHENAWCSWGDQAGEVPRGCQPTDALCSRQRQAGLAALQSLPERCHCLALCPGRCPGLGHSAGAHDCITA